MSSFSQRHAHLSGLTRQSALSDLKPAGPLWREVPTHSEQGEPLNDFMMLIPGLNKLSSQALVAKLDLLQQALASFSDVLVFVDLNLKLNLLWISTRPRPGSSIEIPWQIRQVLPEAKLIANQVEADIGAKRKARWFFWKPWK